MTKTIKRKLGDVGENVAVVYLERHGYRILDRNYLRKWGEIDIVSAKGGIVHFIEVKTVSSETQIRAEENMHPQKIRRLSRAIQTYLLERDVHDNWQLDLAIVKINSKNRTAAIEIIENVN